MSVTWTYINVNSCLCQWYVQEFTWMYRHVCTIPYFYIHAYTGYIHVYNSMYKYKHVYTWYRRVYTTLPNLGEAAFASLGEAAFGSSRGPATRYESKSLQDSKMVHYSKGKYLKFRRGWSMPDSHEKIWGRLKVLILWFTRRSRNP